MIKLTRLDGSELFVNPDLIETIEETPDTHLTLANGKKYIVLEKTPAIVEKIVSGKIDKFLAEICLLEQKYVKDPDLSVQDLLTDCVGKMGENISVKRFARFQIGVE